MKSRIVCRTIIQNKDKSKILLVRNRGAKFWYPPGGGLEESDLNLKECAKREVLEEVGLKVDIGPLQYVQEFETQDNLRYVEFFWLSVADETTLDLKHKDIDPNGLVEEIKWFTQQELENMKVFPVKLKNEFWNQDNQTKSDDVFLLG